MKLVVVFLIVLLQVSSLAQVSDDFSDQDFKQDPTWVGDTSSWQIVSGALKSNHVVASSQFYLSTPSQLVKNTEWSLLVNLQFNTSSANYVDIYLVSDSANVQSKGRNGYFVRIGGTKDEISLYKKINGISTVLIDGLDGVTNKSTNTIALRVTCNDSFRWALQRNLQGVMSDFASEGVIVDSSCKTSNWFGISVVQSTASFFQKHIFDQVSIKTIERDTLPPALVYQDFVTNMNPLTIKFDEPIDTNWMQSAGALQLFDKNERQVKIVKIKMDSLVKNSYRIYFQDVSFDEGEYVLLVNNAKDLAGNVNETKMTDKIVYKKPSFALYKEIVISEILPDPVPSIGLPEKEYVEIFNTTDKMFDLKDYVFSDPSTSVKMPSYLLGPFEYLILCSISDTSNFRKYGKVLGLNALPSLNNTSDVLTIKSSQGVLVDKIAYSLSWFNDTHKDDGGYSLELIDPSNACLKSENWKASNSIVGGTPGTQNSNYRILKDTLRPSVVSVEMLEPNEIKINFSEDVDSAFFTTQNFSIDPTISIDSVVWKSDSLAMLRLKLSQALIRGKEYKITSKQLQDCAGNTSFNRVYSLLLPEQPTTGDVLINELLFNPLPYGSDFVELYSKSDKILDLKGWYIANLKNDTIANKKLLFKNSFLLKPNEYIVLTEDRNNILNTYPKSVADRIIEVAVLPTFYDDIGNVILLSPDAKVIDQFDYNNDMHAASLTKKEGVSLEKINPTFATNDPNNWTSASQQAGYATPGYANSQYIALGIVDDDISIEPSIITPNGDGDKDFMLLSIKSEKLGAIRNIIIFDVMGREVRRLLKNGYSGSHTVIQWDGTDETNNPLPVGHYIVWLEVVDKSGNTSHYKKKVVVGARF